MITIEVDGHSLRGRQGDMLIEVTDQAGITIPRFCYHRKLSIAANCRMCLVEVERAPKPLPACSTPISEGMRVQTRSPKALAAQRATMEFLLINHPLDCPICDQGGECELQDLAMGYGEGVGQYSETKRVVKDKDIGSLIATDMTRCIHCTRCVRFGEEIAGLKELGVVGRSDHMEIGTYIAKSVSSELSGNMIDLCPVGALTAKPSRYTARPWELIQQPHISTHDAFGSNLYLHTRDGRIMRTVPRDNDLINETWLSDRDRFAYEGLFTQDRLTEPMIKRDGAWATVDWDTALAYAAESLQAIVQQQGAAALGGLVSPNASLEEHYLFQKLIRGLGSNNIDHRLRQIDFSADGGDPVMPWLGMDIAQINQLKTIVVIGSSIREEIPLFGHRVRQAALKRGVKVHLVHPFTQDLNFAATQWASSARGGMLDTLIALCRGAGINLPENLVESAPVSEKLVSALLADLNAGKQGAIFLGHLAGNDANFGAIRYLATQLAKSTGAALGILPQGGNAPGAWLAGAVPHRVAGGAQAVGVGANAAQMLAAPKPAMLLLGVEPECDSSAGAAAIEALAASEFVLACASQVTDAMRRYADVLLPVGTAVETAGTWVNGEGRWQSQRGVVRSLGQSRPAWKVLRVLGNLLDLNGFDYMDTNEIRAEVQTACAQVNLSNHSDVLGAVTPSTDNADAQGWVRIAPVGMYAVDGIVRRSPSLQATVQADRQRHCLVNPADATREGWANGDVITVQQSGGSVCLPIQIDEGVAPGTIVVYAGTIESTLPMVSGAVQIVQEAVTC
ncbi:NADH-quinone oxidoreductase subunit G [Halothiobacillus diazotrophicus]|uniref:NADH-quinone oxidoreductase n=1 Tax=Halothiobacillus diazotrophicus TaxID=1860122 RepID=A0A191ZH39_9GAMM|nr:NADH-quinone oxidoreductase subunit NuoG [Halothiobacillus diazotrophicus]ANJ67168.1 NADH-quinone oxidoreductase subunit G [Halothiobacillus diazotrophicus]